MSMKAYQDLTFADDFMFCKVLESDSDLCRRLVELLLGAKVKMIQYKRKHYEIKPTPERRGIQLDVYLDDEVDTVYDLEIQNGHKRELPKRSRYYQGLVDIDNLAPGVKTYLALPDSYIIFICTFDPFDRGKHRYEFRELCVDDPSIRLNDGSCKLFINAESHEAAMSEDMRAFLNYLCGEAPSSDLTRDIEARIIHAKETREWEMSYMTYRDYYAEEFAEAEERVRSEFAQVNKFLLSQKRYDDLERASEDPKFYDSILAEMREAGIVATQP